MSVPEIVVSAGIILNDGKVLLTLRSEKQFVPFVWQFPGGKVNKGESHIQALKRELMEELNIDVLDVHLMAIQTHQFTPTQEWIIYFYLVDRFTGEIRAAENQTLIWTSVYEFDELPIIKPNRKIMNSLKIITTKSKTNFIWEDIWSLETKEFSSLSTRLWRGAAKVRALHKLGFNVQQADRVIDLGSGTGDVSLLLRDEHHNIHYETLCVEKSPNAIKKLTTRLPEDGSIEVIESDVCTIPVPSGFFNMALGVSIIEHVEGAESFLAEVHRILKPNSEFFICQSNRMSAHCIDWQIRKIINHWPYGYQRYYTLSELVNILSPWFIVEEAIISLPDTDAPVHRFIDKMFNIILPKWGRNIFVRARRIT